MTPQAAAPTPAMLSVWSNVRAENCAFQRMRLFVIALREGFTGDACDAFGWVSERVRHFKPELFPQEEWK